MSGTRGGVRIRAIELLDFFKTYTICFPPTQRYVKPDRVGREILCREADYELLVGALKALKIRMNWADLELSLRSAASQRGFLITTYFSTYVDEADLLTQLKLPEEEATTLYCWILKSGRSDAYEQNA